MGSLWDLHGAVGGLDAEQFAGVERDATIDVDDEGRLRGAHVGRRVRAFLEALEHLGGGLQDLTLVDELDHRLKRNQVRQFISSCFHSAEAQELEPVTPEFGRQTK